MNGTCGVRVRQINVSFSIFRTRRRDRAIFHLILVGGFSMNAKYFYQLPYSAVIRYIYSFIYSFLTLSLSPSHSVSSPIAIWMSKFFKPGGFISSLFIMFYTCWMDGRHSNIKKKEITKKKREEKTRAIPSSQSAMDDGCAIAAGYGYEHDTHTQAHVKCCALSWYVFFFHSFSIYFEKRKTREWIMYILFTFKTTQEQCSRERARTQDVDGALRVRPKK